jgi:hypothetical protein
VSAAELQRVEVRFRGERLAEVTEASGVYSLFRTPEGGYIVHTDEGEGQLAWLEAGRDGRGLTEAQIRVLWSELYEAAGL